MAYLKQFLQEKGRGGEHGGHSIYWIPISVFNELPIKRWKHNRPPDKERVADICEYMKQSKRVDGMIYLAHVDNELVCYESNHRREALKGIVDIADILVDVLWGATNESVKAEFQRLNKAVSVPELYVGDDATVNVGEIREAVDGFCKNYAKLKVGSNHPQRPNFNRDMITDEFYRIVRETRITIPELMCRLQSLNNEMATRDRTKLSPKIISKCEQAGLWLFAWSSKLDAKELA